MVRVEEDTNGDGQADKWSSYVNGILTETAFDDDDSGDGRPDRRESSGGGGPQTR